MSDRPNFVPVRPAPPARHRWWRRLHRYRWWRLVRAVGTVLVWAAGTVGVTVWWARQPETGVVEVVLMAATAGVLLAAALIPPDR